MDQKQNYLDGAVIGTGMKKKQTVMIQCRAQDADNGPLLDIRETDRVEYTLMNMQRDDWVFAK